MEMVAKTLPGALRGYLRRDRPCVVEILAPLWPRIAGRVIAEHSRPVAFQGGTLTVATPSEAWAAQLRQLSEEVRAEINSSLGVPVVRRLVVRHSPGSEYRETDAWVRSTAARRAVSGALKA